MTGALQNRMLITQLFVFVFNQTLQMAHNSKDFQDRVTVHNEQFMLLFSGSDLGMKQGEYMTLYAILKVVRTHWTRGNKFSLHLRLSVTAYVGKHVRREHRQAADYKVFRVCCEYGLLLCW